MAVKSKMPDRRWNIRPDTRCTVKNPTGWRILSESNKINTGYYYTDTDILHYLLTYIDDLKKVVHNYCISYIGIIFQLSECSPTKWRWLSRNSRKHDLYHFLLRMYILSNFKINGSYWYLKKIRLKTSKYISFLLI